MKIKRLLRNIALIAAAAVALAGWDFHRVFHDKAGVFQRDSVFLSDTDSLYIVIHHTGNDERFSLREIEDFHRSQSWRKGVTASGVMSVTWFVSTAKPVDEEEIELAQIMSIEDRKSVV